MPGKRGPSLRGGNALERGLKRVMRGKSFFEPKGLPTKPKKAKAPGKKKKVQHRTEYGFHKGHRGGPGFGG